MLCVPLPATAGLKAPEVTPMPVNVPPAGVATNVTGDALLHTGDWLIVKFSCGNAFTVTFLVAGADVPQPVAVIVIAPPPVPATALIVVVADVPVQPLGRVHVYDVAPVTDVTENVAVAPLQRLSGPVIDAGAAVVAVIVTVLVCATELPQPLLAVTETTPAPTPATAFILAVVEVPLQPDGRVHVYDVAPFTAVIE